MVEVRPLTEEELLRAESRVDYYHPVVDVIDQNLPRITTLIAESGSLTRDQRRSFLATGLGFLADAIVDAGSFTLEPLDMVAIWSKVVDVFPVSDAFRYPLAAAASSAYAIQSIDNPAWRKFPAHFLKTHSIPEELMLDRGGLEHVSGRLGEVKTNYDFLAHYRSKSSVIDQFSENFANGFGNLRVVVAEALMPRRIK